MNPANHGADSTQSDLTAGSGKRRESNTRGWWLRRGSLIRKGKERKENLWTDYGFDVVTVHFGYDVKTIPNLKIC